MELVGVKMQKFDRWSVRVNEPGQYKSRLISSMNEFGSLLTGYSHLMNDSMNSIEQVFWAELAQIHSDSIGMNRGALCFDLWVLAKRAE